MLKASRGAVEVLEKSHPVQDKLMEKVFVDMIDMGEHIKGHWEGLTNEKLEEVVESSIVENEEETEAEPAGWTLPKFARVFQITDIKGQNCGTQSLEAM